MIRATNHNPLLELEGIHASYVKKEILRGVSLKVNSGEVVALLGGNGSGKSTTLKAISGLLHPTNGRILFEGTDITNTSVHLRQQMGIGYLLQGGRIFPNLTVEENLHIAIKHRRDGLLGKSESGLEDLFPELLKRRGSRAGELSGGQRQMLAIAMVLVQHPRIALLDEPTSALSADMAQAVLQKISDFSKSSGGAVLLVEQNVTEAMNISNRSLRLDEGFIHKSTNNE